jgi:hypothetical protein
MQVHVLNHVQLSCKGFRRLAKIIKSYFKTFKQTNIIDVIKVCLHLLNVRLFVTCMFSCCIEMDRHMTTYLVSDLMHFAKPEKNKTQTHVSLMGAPQTSNNIHVVYEISSVKFNYQHHFQLSDKLIVISTSMITNPIHLE